MSGDNEQGGNFYAETPWGWRDRLRFRLFPSQLCPLPEAPATYKDCIVIRTVVVLRFPARLQLLISGRLIVETRTVTENVVGNAVSASVAYPTLKD
jgi:hypothetical protein